MTIGSQHSDPKQPSRLALQTVGVSLIASPPVSALSIGYSKDELTFFALPGGVAEPEGEVSVGEKGLGTDPLG
jgi:hypothetical protein